MLAPLIYYMLIVSLLVLFAGWGIDALRATMRVRRGHGELAGPAARNRASRPWKPLPRDERIAKWRARPGRRQRPAGRFPSYRLAIGRLLSQAPEPRGAIDSASGL